MIHTWLAPENLARRHQKPRLVPVGSALPPQSYDLTGDGIWMAYFPHGLGSVRSTDAARLLYRDAHGTRTFGSREIETTPAAGFGTVVTVVLDRGPETSETLSLVIPDIEAQGTGLPVSLRTFAVTSVRRAGIRTAGHLPRETHTVTPLTGQVVGGPAPTKMRSNVKVTPVEAERTTLLPALFAAALGHEGRTG